MGSRRSWTVMSLVACAAADPLWVKPRLHGTHPKPRLHHRPAPLLALESADRRGEESWTKWLNRIKGQTTMSQCLLAITLSANVIHTLMLLADPEAAREHAELMWVVRDGPAARAQRGAGALAVLAAWGASEMYGHLSKVWHRQEKSVATEGQRVGREVGAMFAGHCPVPDAHEMLVRQYLNTLKTDDQLAVAMASVYGATGMDESTPTRWLQYIEDLKADAEERGLAPEAGRYETLHVLAARKLLLQDCEALAKCFTLTSRSVPRREYTALDILEKAQRRGGDPDASFSLEKDRIEMKKALAQLDAEAEDREHRMRKECEGLVLQF